MARLEFVSDNNVTLRLTTFGLCADIVDCSEVRTFKLTEREEIVKLIEWLDDERTRLDD